MIGLLKVAAVVVVATLSGVGLTVTLVGLLLVVTK
jgi:hypothetical protein